VVTAGLRPCKPQASSEVEAERIDMEKTELMSKSELEKASDAKIAIIEATIRAFDRQIIDVLNYCANVQITETVVTEAERQSITVIFNHILNQ